jgi:hypothetical protein
MNSLEQKARHTQQVDMLQAHLGKLPQLDCPVTNRFTPGLYIREIFMPKGSLIISKIHKTEHPFIVSKGHAAVWTEESGVVQIKAPHTGITKPGTRRILYIHEDCIWTTFHPTTETDVARIEEQIIEPHDCSQALGDEERFKFCMEKARALVESYREDAPKGCDPQNSWVAVGVSAAVAIGTTVYAVESAPGAPETPDVAASSRAGIEADAATLADRRRMEAAAQQGGSATYTTAAHKKKVDAVQVVPMGKFLGMEMPLYSKAKWMQYDPKDWQPGGQYADPLLFKQDPKHKRKKVKIPSQTKTVDFTGYGEADVQGKIARQSAENILALQEKYGKQFIEEAIRQQELADPEGTAARAKLYELIQQQATAEKPDRPVADLLDSQVSEQLAAGKGLDRISSDVLREAVAASLSARGDSAGGADFSQPLTSGFEGQRRLDAGQQKALSWLTSGATPEDVEYRREQQIMADLAAFVNGQTPQSQFQNLSSAQNGPAPYYQGNPLPGQNPNAGPAMQNAQLQGWNAQMGFESSQVDPWMAGLSAIINGAGAAGQAGWKPMA